MSSTKSILHGRMAAIGLDEPLQVGHEANLCLGCYDAPCISGCPTRINIPEFIGRIRTDNLEGAYHTLVSANPLPAVCGLVCPTEHLCESKCLVTRLSGKPVSIAALQCFVCNQVQFDETWQTTQANRVAVVGGGPAGLACGIGLRRLGYPVDLYDDHEHLGGLLAFSIPNYRLPDSTVQAEIHRLENSGIKFHMGVTVDAVHLVRMKNEYQALFLSIGLSSGKPYQVTGATLKGVWQALDYLAAVRRAGRREGLPPERVEQVVIIGGGNVALDSACVAALETASKVMVVYRRSHQEMPAWESEYQNALSLGIEFRWLTDLVEIIGHQGQVSGVRVHHMQLLDRIDSAGKRAVAPVPESEEILPCNAVILAIGQTLKFDQLDTIGLELGTGGLLKIDPETLQTTLPGVFAGGDLVRGPSYVVQAIADGMQASEAIHRFLCAEDAK